jgi:hypothetical protein
MSGTGSDAGGGGVSGVGLQSLLDKFSNSPAGASQFSADGSTPSQFTMPGGGIPQYQGAQMMPATLGGAQGVQDAQDWTQAVNQYGGGMTGANYAQIAQGLAGAGGNLKAPETPQPPRGGAAGGGMRNQAQANYLPAQIPLGLAGGAPQQGTMNLAGAATQANPTGSVQNLLKLLQMGNKGFNV